MGDSHLDEQFLCGASSSLFGIALLPRRLFCEQQEDLRGGRCWAVKMTVQAG